MGKEVKTQNIKDLVTQLADACEEGGVHLVVYVEQDGAPLFGAVNRPHAKETRNFEEFAARDIADGARALERALRIKGVLIE